MLQAEFSLGLGGDGPSSPPNTAEREEEEEEGCWGKQSHDFHTHRAASQQIHQGTSSNLHPSSLLHWDTPGETPASPSTTLA